MARRIAYSGSFHGVDHERFASNEELYLPVNGAIILTDEDVPQSFAPISLAWGGEVQATFIVTASLFQKNRVGILVNGKLFEGTNETGILEDEKNDDLVVPRGGSPVPFTMNLFNDGWLGGGGDSASLSLTFTNNLVEDEEDEDEEPDQVNIQHMDHFLRPRFEDRFIALRRIQV